jgi:hypothetical protein
MKWLKYELLMVILVLAIMIPISLEVSLIIKVVVYGEPEIAIPIDMIFSGKIK